MPAYRAQIGGEDFALVRGHQDVVGGDLLGEKGDLPLDLGDAAIGAPCAARILEHPFLDDLRAESPGCTPQRVGEELVCGMGAGDEQPSAPSLRDEVLG